MQYLCTTCDYVTVNKECYSQHLQENHNYTVTEKSSGQKTLPKYTCALCDYQTRKKLLLKTHQKVHSADKQWQCAQCDYKTSWKNNLKRHTESIHYNIRYPCDLCSYTTTRTRYLKEHLRFVHHNWTNEIYCALSKPFLKVNTLNTQDIEKA